MRFSLRAARLPRNKSRKSSRTIIHQQPRYDNNNSSRVFIRSVLPFDVQRFGKMESYRCRSGILGFVDIARRPSHRMKRWRAESIRFLLVSSLFLGSLAIAPVGCENWTPEQINATGAAITSVITTTGQVVTPLVINYSNGKSVRVKKPKPTPTSTPKP